MTELSTRLAQVRAEIEEAAQAAGRSGEVALLAVSKTVGADHIREAYDAGQRLFGENRVQEAASKVSSLRHVMPEAEWHLIGHLQSNKARTATETFQCVQSVDSLKLATLLDRLTREGGHPVLSVLVEVNVAAEAAKSGFLLDHLDREMESLLALTHLGIDGLMTVAPLTEDVEDVRWVFRRLRETRDAIQGREGGQTCRALSMGMSNDFKVAIQEGATMVRVGRAIFGSRPPVRGQ
jgi:pyridoxal phosphate enzyme (YggS family)